MSILTYNGVTLPYANCTYFDISPVYDEIGRVDPMYTRYEIMVNCVINPNYAGILDNTEASPFYIDDELVVSNPAQVMAAIQQRLQQPRMGLSYSFNGVELIPQPPVGVEGTVDARNGPVTDCQIFNLTNESFMIRFHVIAHYTRNTVSNTVAGETTTFDLSGGPVINNRWVEQISLDPSGYTRRVRTGKFTIRSDNPEGLTVDHYRNYFAVVGVPFGFLRESSDYDVAPDGLGVMYRVVDKEVFKLPPAPAFESQGKYIETGTKNAAVRYGQVRLALRAAKNVSQSRLINVAIGVATSKLIGRGASAVGGGPDSPKTVTLDGKDGFGIVTQAVLVVDMYDNAVDVIIEVMLAAQTVEGKGNQRIHGIAALAGGRYAAFTPGSEDEKGNPIASTPPYTTRGTANLLLSVAAYFDPALATNSTKLNTAPPSPDDNIFVPSDARANRTGGDQAIVPGQAGKQPEERKD